MSVEIGSPAPAGGASDHDLPTGVAERLAALGHGAPVAAEALAGGIISRVRRLRDARGATVVLKQRPDAPPGMFQAEADGLAALAGLPGIAVPSVLGVGRTWLLLEDLGDQPGDGDLEAPPAFWETFGRGLAHLHGRIVSRFGWPRDTWWGLLRYDNRWRVDGHAFFAETRFLSFLDRPRLARVLTRDDRRQVERIADRLRELVPAQPPSLCHGDIWAGNRGRARDGRPAMLDPFIHYGWPEFDLHHCRMFGGFPERFFDAYLESHPLEPGWRARSEVFDVLHLLGMVEHGWDSELPWLRRLLIRFAG